MAGPIGFGSRRYSPPHAGPPKTADSGVPEPESKPTVPDPGGAEPRGPTSPGDDLGADAPGAREAGRLRQWVARSRQWTGAERDRVEAALQDRRHTSTVIGAGFDIRELDVHVGGGILAGAVAFRMFLFMVPFVYVVFSVVGLTARTLSEDPAQLARTVGITGVLASAVVNTTHISVFSQIALLAGALVALVLTANSLTKTLSVVHWLIWRFGRSRPKGPRAIAATVGIALALTALSVASNKLRESTGIVGSLLVVVLVTAAAFALWWWVSWLLPHAPTSPRSLIPGALFVALGVDVMQALTLYWIGPLVARKSNTYGSVGISLAVLLWVYIFGRIIVGSAGLNVTLWRRAGGTTPDGARTGEAA